MRVIMNARMIALAKAEHPSRPRGQLGPVEHFGRRIHCTDLGVDLPAAGQCDLATIFSSVSGKWCSHNVCYRLRFT